MQKVRVKAGGAWGGGESFCRILVWDGLCTGKYVYIYVYVYTSSFFNWKVMWLLKVLKARRVTNSNAYAFPFSIKEILFAMVPEKPIFFSPLLHPHAFCTWLFFSGHPTWFIWRWMCGQGRSGVERGWAVAVYQMPCSPSYPRAMFLGFYSDFLNPTQKFEYKCLSLFLRGLVAT